MRALGLTMAMAAAAMASPLSDRIRLLDHRLPYPTAADGRAKPDDAGVYDIERLEIEIDIPPAGLPERALFRVTLGVRERFQLLSLVSFGYDPLSIRAEGGAELDFSREQFEVVVTLEAPVDPGDTVTLVIEAVIDIDCAPDPTTCVDDGEVRHLASAAWLPLSAEFPLTDRFLIRTTFRGDGTVRPAATGVPVDPSPGPGVAWAFEMETPSVLPVFVLSAFVVEPLEDLVVYRPPQTSVEHLRVIETVRAGRAFYSAVFGAFPYTPLGVGPIDPRAQVALGPQALLLIPTGEWTGMGRRIDPVELERVVAHELGHQYFFNALAVLDPDESWLSEGFAEFAATRYSEAASGTDDHYRDNYWAYVLGVGQGDDEPLHSVAANESPHRVRIIYLKGSAVMEQLRRRLGTESFDAAMQAYIERLSGQITTTRELRATFEDVTGASLRTFFDQWIERAGFPDLVASVEPARTERAELQLTLRQRANRHGEFGGPTPILLHRDVAQPIATEIALGAGSYTFSDERAQWIEIDPDLSFFRRIRPEPAGDVNLSGVVDGMDLLDVVAAQGAVPGPGWADRVDVNDDQTIDERDLEQLQRQFGEGW